MTYQTAEQQLWQRYGAEPSERFVELASPPVRLRVVEAGAGDPVVFIGGTGGTGAYWAPLVQELEGFRCLLMDRPGWGMSSAVDYGKYEFKAMVTDVLRGLLDSLGLEKVSLVGASVGNLWAMRLAQCHPARVEKIVLLGGGPNPEIPMGTFLKLLASPIGKLMVSLPMRPKMLVSQLRALGHGASLESGRMADFVEWRMSLVNETKSMANERAMVRALLEGGKFRPGFAFEDAELAQIPHPTLMVYGSADPTGDVGIWRRFVDQLPQGQLKILDGHGHMPWWDDPKAVGDEVATFLRAT